MRDKAKTKEKLIAKLEKMRQRIAELEALDTEHKRAEEALRESQTKFNAVVQSANDAIILTDTGGNIVSWNKGAQIIFGYREGEVLGRPLTLIMPERYRHDHRKGLERFHSTGESGVIGKTVELQGLRKNGSEFPLELSLSSWKTKKGRLYSGIIRDITRRKGAEEALRKAHDGLEQKVQQRTTELRASNRSLRREIIERTQAEEASRSLAAIVESSDDAIIAWDLEGKITSWNKAAERMCGYAAWEVLGKSTDIIVPEDRREELWQILDMVKHGRLVDHLETVRVAKDGRRLDVSLTVSPVRDRKDNIAGASSIARDITERKRIQEALEGLRRQNELILESAGEGIYGLDGDGKTSFVNPAAARMIGWEVEDLIGQPMHAILHHSKPDGAPYPEAECPIYAAFQDGAVHRIDTEVFWRKDGTSFPVGYISTPIRDHGKVVGAVVTFKDLTIERQTERLAMLGQVAAGVAHELNNALGVVLASAQLLLKQTDPHSAAYSDLELIEKYAGTCGRITQDLRLLGRPLPLKCEMVQLSPLIEETLKPLEPTLESRKVKVNVVLDPHLPALSIDPRLLSQALVNLITNAVEAMPDGGILSLAARLRPKKFVEIAVSDTGLGIAREHLDQIFDPFFTINPTGEGMGLGLTITSRIVEDHGGRLEVTSELGKGSTFQVILPHLEIPETAS